MQFPRKNDKKPNTTPQVNNKICLQCDSSDKLPSNKIAQKWTNIPPARFRSQNVFLFVHKATIVKENLFCARTHVRFSFLKKIFYSKRLLVQGVQS